MYIIKKEEQNFNIKLKFVVFNFCVFRYYFRLSMLICSILFFSISSLVILFLLLIGLYFFIYFDIFSWPLFPQVLYIYNNSIQHRICLCFLKISFQMFKLYFYLSWQILGVFKPAQNKVKGWKIASKPLWIYQAAELSRYLNAFRLGVKVGFHWSRFQNSM